MENKNTYRRVGVTSKCPACGVQVDEGAYRCPKCLIFFCFKCRRRVQQSEAQSQCLNQKCDYYGKLLCKVCVKQVPRYSVRSKQVYESMLTNNHKFIVFGLITIACVSLLLKLGLTGEILIVSTLILSLPSTYFFTNLKKSRLIEEEFSSGDVNCCIACEQPVEKLHSGN